MKIKQKNVCLDMDIGRDKYPLSWLYEDYMVYTSKEIDKIDNKIRKNAKAGKSTKKDGEKKDDLQQRRNNAYEFVQCFVEDGTDCNNDTEL